MAYVKKDWEDLPSQTTPVTANDLDRIENGIEENDKRLNGTKSIDNTIYANDFKCRNMFNTNTCSLASYINDSGVIVTGSAPNILSDYIEVKPNTTYVISANTTIAYIRVHEFNSSKTWLQRIAGNSVSSLTVTTSNNTQYIRVTYNKDNATTMTPILLQQVQAQIEIGEQTAYTPYKNFDNTEYGLFEGKSNGNITLNDSVSNYEYIEIFYSNSAGTLNSSVKFKYYEGGYRTTLQLTNLPTVSTNQNTQLFFKIISISGTSLTVEGNRAIYMTAPATDYSTATMTSAQDNIIYIRRIIGYKS